MGKRMTRERILSFIDFLVIFSLSFNPVLRSPVGLVPLNRLAVIWLTLGAIAPHSKRLSLAKPQPYILSLTVIFIVYTLNSFRTNDLVLRTAGYVLVGFILRGLVLNAPRFAGHPRRVISLFIKACVVQSVLVLVVFYEPVATIVYGVFAVSDLVRHNLLLGFRSSGIMYSGFSQLSVILAMGSVFYFSTGGLNSSNSRRISLFRFLLAQALLMAGVLASGRTGLVLVLGYYFVIGLVTGASRKRLSKNQASMIRIGFLSSFGVVVFFLSTVNLSESLEKMLEPVLYLVREGTLVSPSVRILFENHWNLPSGWNNILFGLGYSWRSAGSDAGFVQMIYEGGIILMLAASAVYLYPLIRALKSRDLDHKSTNSIAIFFMILVYIIYNIKDYYYLFLTGPTIAWIAVSEKERHCVDRVHNLRPELSSSRSGGV